VSGDRREGDERDDSAPDFDARWQELAAELGQSLPPDLQDWVTGGTADGPAGSSDDQSAATPRRQPGARSNPDTATGGHVVWAAEPPDADSPDGSERSAVRDPEVFEGLLDSADDTVVYGPRDWSPPEAEDHFEPPEPPPVLGGDPLVTLGWIALIAGLAVVFAWAMFRTLAPSWLARAGLLAIVAGAAALIWKMPHRRDPEDDSDGAQV
jgi:hypothetical protein